MNRKNTAKRLLSRIVSCAMILGMLPVTAAALPVYPVDIDTINITGVVPPFPGEYPNVSGITTDTPGITIVSKGWHNGDALVQDDHRFQASVEYYLGVSFTVDPGYELLDDFTVTSDLEYG